MGIKKPIKNFTDEMRAQLPRNEADFRKMLGNLGIDPKILQRVYSLMNSSINWNYYQGIPVYFMDALLSATSTHAPVEYLSTGAFSERSIPSEQNQVINENRRRKAFNASNAKQFAEEREIYDAVAAHYIAPEKSNNFFAHNFKYLSPGKFVKDKSLAQIELTKQLHGDKHKIKTWYGKYLLTAAEEVNRAKSNEEFVAKLADAGFSPKVIQELKDLFFKNHKSYDRISENRCDFKKYLGIPAAFIKMLEKEEEYDRVQLQAQQNDYFSTNKEIQDHFNNKYVPGKDGRLSIKQHHELVLLLLDEISAKYVPPSNKKGPGHFGKELKKVA